MNFGLVGCGRIGRIHAKELASRGKLQAVCDVQSGSATHIGEQYNANIYSSIEEMLAGEKELDLIAICTPNGFHSEHSIMALKNGCHVVCEKPMALTTKDAGLMIKEAALAARHLFVVKQNRFNPPVMAVKGLLDSGSLGKIHSAALNCYWNRNSEYYYDSWRGSLDLDGGTLYTQFSHFVDLILWFFGDLADVRGFSGNLMHKDVIDFEDTGVIAIKFKNGILATVNYTVNAFNKNMEGSLVIFGEKGTVKIGGQYLNELEYLQMSDKNVPEIKPGNQANQYGSYSGSMSNHSLVYDNVLEVLNGYKEMVATPEEGLNTVRAINRIYQAIRS